MIGKSKVGPSVVMVDADTRLLAHMIANCSDRAMQRDDVGTGGGGHLHLVNFGIRVVTQISVNGDEEMIMIVFGMKGWQEQAQHRQHDDGEERTRTDLG